jgi:hypothetical protein
MDEALIQLPGIHYQSYVDDILLLGKTEYQLRRAKSVLFAHLNRLHLRIRPKKTFSGTTQDKLVYLGYVILPDGFAVSDSSVKRLKGKLRQLISQQVSTEKQDRYLEHWSRAFKRVPDVHLRALILKIKKQLVQESQINIPKAKPTDHHRKPVNRAQAPGVEFILLQMIALIYPLLRRLIPAVILRVTPGDRRLRELLLIWPYSTGPPC